MSRIYKLDDRICFVGGNWFWKYEQVSMLFDQKDSNIVGLIIEKLEDKKYWRFYPEQFHITITSASFFEKI